MVWRPQLFMRHVLLLATLGSSCQPDSQQMPSQIQAENAAVPPAQGPGLGNLEYGSADLLKPLTLFNRSNFIPPTYPFRKDFGTNAAILHNGYLVTVFAPDSGNGPGGFLVLDVSNPRDVKLVKRIYEPEGLTKEFREAHSFGNALVDGKKLLALQTGKGIEIWDFTDVNRIAPLSRLELPGVNYGDYSSVSWQLWWQAPYLYVASANQGIFVVDTKDPLHPKLADRGTGKANPIPVGELGGFRVGPIFVLGNIMVISSMDVEDGFSTLDISDPLNPRLLSRVDRLPKYYATCFDGRFLHASVRGAGARMHSYDLIDPLQPRLVNEQLTVDEQLYCATQDQFVFQGAQEWVHKIDVSQSTAFREVGKGKLGVDHADHGQVTAFGNLVFVGNDHGTGSAFFPHQTTPDRLPPRLIRQSPAAGELNVRLSSRIGLAFSDNILVESLTPENFQVKDELGRVVAGTLSVQLGLVNFTPAAALSPQTRYDIVLKALGVRDYAGNGMTEDIRSSFYTGKSDPSKSLENYSFDEGFRSNLILENPQYKEGGLDLANTTQITLPSYVAGKMAGNASLSFYMKTTQTGSDKAWEAPGLMGKDEGFLKNDMFWGWLDSKGFLHLSTGDQAGAKTRLAINDGLWHHFVLTRNATSGQLKIYKDAVLESTQVGTKGRIELDWNRLGQIQPSGAKLQAILDELQIYDSELSEQDVQTLAGQTVINLSLKTRQQIQTFEEPMQLSVDGIRGPQQNLTLVWDFGDGTTAQGTKVTHQYQTPGFYNLRLLTQAAGKTDSLNFIKRVFRKPTARPPLRSTSVTSDSSLVYVVNPDSNTVTAVNYLQQKKIWEQTVGEQPRTLSLDSQQRLWIANQASDSLTIVSALDGKILQTVGLPYGTAPYAVFVDQDSGRVYVTGESGQSILMLDETGRLLGSKKLSYKPRGLSLDSERKILYVTRFISGPSAAEIHRYQAGTLDEESALLIPIDSQTTDAEDRGRGLVNYLSQVVLAPDGQSLIVPSLKDNIRRGLFQNGEKLTPDNSVRTVLNQITLGNQSLHQLDFNDREGAVAAVFSPLGDFIFTLLQGSQSVEIIDAARQSQVGSIDQAGLAPQGLDISPDGSFLFIQGLLSRDLAVYDIRPLLAGDSYAPQLVGRISTVTRELMSEQELRGKRIFYLARDARMSRDGYISCASCHLDGQEDGQVWDFTERGEGLRNTISLMGRRGTGHGKVHWTANFDEIQDFENDIRFAFGGTGFIQEKDFEAVKDPLGKSKAGLSVELDDLATYVSSLKSFGRSPWRPGKDQLSVDAEAGRLLFTKKECVVCHAGPEFTDGQRHDIGTIIAASGLGQSKSLEGIGFDTPTLRGLWSTAPYLHAGQALTAADAIKAHGKILKTALSADELRALEAYVLSLE